MAFTPTDYVDITAEHEKKKAAMFAHKTQDPVNTYNDYFKPLEEFSGVRGRCKNGRKRLFILKQPVGRAGIIGL